ncbi:hypothetical protein ACIQFU_04995 [Streptomyces sp. NPDC093065]|uniref:hypothetical protein n=1 Tax=Streptomyces sp. NPDC093065 TaxID=3366021 RepID=UPI00382950F4
MADEQDEWLDRETAELMLRGKPPEGLESTDPATRDRAGRLVAALGVLSAPPAPTGEELPGEAAALAVFRKVRAERADASADAPAGLGHGTAPGPADAGLVRIGPRGDGTRRTHWSRPLRLGLAAALTVGMVGGVAVAAGTGVLPTPFDRTEPEPAATASAATSPDRPLAPPSPLEGTLGGADPGTASGAPGGGTARDGGRTGDRDADDRDADGADGRRSGLAASCRKARAGKQLDAAHRRALKEAAGGASRVGKYCGTLLAASGTGGRDGGEHGDSGEASYEGELRKDTGGGKGDRGGKGDKNGRNGKGDKENSGDKDKGGKKGDDGHGGRGDQDDDGDDGGNDGNGDDDDADITPPVRGHHRPHGPHAPPAHEPRPQRAPAYARCAMYSAKAA